MTRNYKKKGAKTRTVRVDDQIKKKLDNIQRQYYQDFGKIISQREALSILFKKK